MDDLSRLPFDCQCPDCVSDPDPATDYALPGDLVYGSPEWFTLMATIPVADPDEFLSEYDLLEDDRPTWEDLEAWEEATRDEPTAAELALAVAEIRQGEDQYNGYDDPGYREWKAEFNRRQLMQLIDDMGPDQPDDLPEYDEDVEIRGHRAGTDLD